jgi:hypothetical protein
LQLTDHFTEAFDDAQHDGAPHGTRAQHLLRPGGKRRKDETDGENDREPHGHLGGGWLAGSLAEGHDAHQHGDASAQINHDQRLG